MHVLRTLNVHFAFCRVGLLIYICPTYMYTISADAVTCYDCNELKNQSCPDPFDRTSADVQTVRCNSTIQWCDKYIIKFAGMSALLITLYIALKISAWKFKSEAYNQLDTSF